MCRKCKEEKPLSEFGANKRYEGGLERRCKECLRGMRQDAYDRNPELYRQAANRKRKYRREPGGPDSPEGRRRRHLQEAYGITPEDEKRLLESQGGLCPICGSPAQVVDHCHTTGRVRGLLCQKCNRGLGHFIDNPVMLVRALEYLTQSRLEYHRMNTVVGA